MMHTYVRLAFDSLRAAKWRSFLTMFGIIISVASVITIVGLGEGVKQQLVGQVNASGSDLITIRGGNVSAKPNSLSPSDVATVFGKTTLGGQDLSTTEQTEGVQYAVPFASVAGEVMLSEEPTGHHDVTVIATNERAADALGQPIASGNFFNTSDTNAATAVVGKDVAERLFKQNVPIGQSFMLRDRKITVSGVFAPFDFNPLTPGLDYNNVIFIPYGLAGELAGSSLLPYQILVRPVDATEAPALAERLQERLQEAHSRQRDFSVLTAEDTLALADSMLALLTKLVGVIAGIALLVGGIGIMNITLASVSERTQEIGIRKSVGATNRQILGQFMAEAVVLSFLGAVSGIMLALVVNYCLRLFSSFEPALNWPVMAGSVVVALIVGSVFGIAPALKAARKDPIQALRRYQ